MITRPQTVKTPPGCRIGWKVVSQTRHPIYQKTFTHHRYTKGSIHIAENNGDPKQHWRFGFFQTAKGLKKCREFETVTRCLPGIHLCLTVKDARNWQITHSKGKFSIIIPVAYSKRSIVGTKDESTVVVHRIKVLG